jgi:N-methylhydantoinase B
MNPAHGVRGGRSGTPAVQYRIDRAGNAHELPICGRVAIAEGERVVSASAGGGGYGSPTKREPQLVSNDVAEGWITRKRAAQVYHVALDAEGDVDWAETAILRQER